ncbi:flagellar basal body rod protein FlgC [Endozoicomonas sp. ALE010]|uniref:flagellar basal body rod protein FlgC n=1 Tax=Endozoicomonas sp. ALE010 TaxID=3403081 RepID=UPI003BB4B1DA
MSLQLVQAMSGYSMVAQATRMTLVAEALSYNEVAAASAAEVMRPGRALLQARTVDAGSAARENIPAFTVEVAGIIKDKSPPQVRYQPGHPLANANGEVFYPNISTIEEMATMISAARSFDAAVSVFTSARQMQGQALELIGVHS